MSGLPPLPRASQPQIIRAYQKDLFYNFFLREESENVLRSIFGTRWLSKWDKEVELFTKLLYYGLTTLRGLQSLGEEYVDIRPISTKNRRLPNLKLRAAMLLLPTLPSYLISRFSRNLPLDPEGRVSRFIRAVPNFLEILTEINLATFYFSGAYYSLSSRILRVRHMSSVSVNPNFKPPSYSFLGILLSIRLLNRLYNLVHQYLPALSTLSASSPSESEPNLSTETYIDSEPISSLVPTPAQLANSTEDPWGDRTVLDLGTIDPEVRVGQRKCALCLEERTASSVTECGHMFCWTCVVGWAREKAECPLCRQSLDLARILPVYNL
ncbi:Pex12 amino terminal region-domain-containing protein [Cantharellus anzutake]|uniref:Pex12 amino terminal region-domain-containing protein n=1 Tax=Cantharellus anzutake TaxID=1750568 RepID=UPI001902D43F|nr:Pex12 amino terminal region-domain-containing protein [Cantharellus anzutake]KAF8343787.1 Pex12 amino terminal region-domain-containing protein [Cantharellus anzutake]